MEIRSSEIDSEPVPLTTPEEHDALARWAFGSRALVEIGVFEGASAKVLRRVMAQDGILHLIDPFIPDSMVQELQGRSQVAHREVEAVHNGSVQWYREFSHIVARGWTTPLDFLFIDGDHAEAACQRDWDDWSPHVQRGGKVAFHDARQGLVGESDAFDGWPGPTAVVNRLFRGGSALRNWSIVEEIGSLVVLRRHE